MEKNDKAKYRSSGVLGDLFRDIKKEEEMALASFKRFDYANSILLEYDLD